uniref:Uncharacterized protein n=1 Tax=Trichogramma kaykai TaxID=54128 RepID=A0ABD2VSQ7_9HYME
MSNTETYAHGLYVYLHIYSTWCCSSANKHTGVHTYLYKRTYASERTSCVLSKDQNDARNHEFRCFRVERAWLYCLGSSGLKNGIENQALSSCC